MNLQKLILPVTLIYFTLICLACLTVPFFWDVTFFSHQANCIYSSAHWFSALPQEVDTGGFPLYALWLSSAWLLFGKTLAVSHLAILPFTLGVVWAYHRLAKKLLHETVLPWAMLLLCVEPAFITQGILMAYDIPALFFFLLAINALLDKKMVRYALALGLIAFSTKRGAITVFSLFLIQLVLTSSKERFRLKFFLPFIPAVLALTLWAVCHHFLTGWYFFYPEPKLAGEKILSLSEMGKKYLLLKWKLADSGRIFLWLIALGGGWNLIRSGKKDPALRTLFVITLIPAVVFLLLLAALSNPAGDRYFLPVFPGLCLLVCALIQHLEVRKRIPLLLILVAGLFTGNFWIYPERFSNNWDTSLKVIPFFELKDQMLNFIRKEKIRPETIATQFPLIDPLRYTNLLNSDLHFTNAADGPVSKFHYYLHSNVCNTDLLPQIEAIKPTWKLLKELHNGQVYIALYENPNFR